MPTISQITCHKILNSRGSWTIETHVELDDGSTGIQSIPEGASKGEKEAISIPVDKAVELVTTVIHDALYGLDAKNQKLIDDTLIKMDGTPNKAHLGANSILSVSLAAAKAVAISQKIELWDYLSLLYSGQQKIKSNIKFPTPIFNILNGGKHAHNKLSFQEFMVIPSKSMPIAEAIDIGTKIYHNLQVKLLDAGLDVEVGDEGGFAPTGLNTNKALKFIKEAGSKDYAVGSQVFFGMDVASESFHNSEGYFIEEENFQLNSDQLQDYYKDLFNKFELIYIEDPFYEKDLLAWQKFNAEFGKKLMVVGDDLCATNTDILKNVIEQKLCNAVIVKPNQIGTLTETLEFIKMAKSAGMAVIISHRSGDTAEDTFIADLAVAVDADFMKSGAPVRGERVAKYNRLLEIASDIK